MIYPAEEKNYYSHFNLVRDPFPLDIVDKILYLTPELNHRLEVLVNRIKAGGPMQIVISPAGGGKSVMAEYLVSLKESNWLAGLVRGDAKLEKESLALELLKKIFPDREFEKQQAVNQLHLLLESATLNGKIPVFIIDDAHELSPDCLQFVLQLAMMRHNDAKFRIILFAAETINDVLDKPGLQENSEDIITELNLPPLSPDQTRAYIENRLSLSGEINRYPFSDAELAQIARISAGLPGGINLLARQVMQLKSAQQPRKPAWTGRLLIITACLLIVLLLPVGYHYLTRQGAVTDPATAVVISAAKQGSEVKAKPKVKIKPAAPAKTTAIDQQLFDAQVSLDLPKSVNPAGIDADTDSGRPAPIAAEDAAAPAPAQIQDIPVSSVPVPEEGEQREDGLSRDTPVEVVPEPGAAADQYAVSHDEYAPDNIYRLDSVPDIVKGINGPGWLRQQSPDLFVLQILSVSAFSNLERMLKKIPEMQGQLSGYTNYTPSGKPRYLLYYGLYPDRETAYAAVKDIPPPLQTVKPWPRDIRSIIIQLDGLEARGYY